MSSAPAPSRPGGRTALNSQRIFAATMALLVEGGFAGVTFQAVAERAGVGRATLYRRWSNPAALVGEAVRAVAAERIVMPDSGSLRGDLATTLSQVARFLSEPVGKAALIAALSLPDGEDGGAQSGWPARWNDVEPLFARAAARGELPAGTDAEALFARLSGALYFRLLVMDQSPDEAWITRILDSEFRPR